MLASFRKLSFDLITRSTNLRTAQSGGESKRFSAAMARPRVLVTRGDIPDAGLDLLKSK